MRTKAEILAKIVKIREWRDNSGIEVKTYKRQHQQACNLIIMGMRYALGYKAEALFWCVCCALYHKNLKCPYCGNETLKVE